MDKKTAASGTVGLDLAVLRQVPGGSGQRSAATDLTAAEHTSLAQEMEAYVTGNSAQVASYEPAINAVHFPMTINEEINNSSMNL